MPEGHILFKFAESSKDDTPCDKTLSHSTPFLTSTPNPLLKFSSNSMNYEIPAQKPSKLRNVSRPLSTLNSTLFSQLEAFEWRVQMSL